MKYQGVVFDLDGTLLNTLADLATAMNAALRSADLPAHPTEAYKMYIGGGLMNLIHRTAPSSVDDAALETRLVADMQAEYSKCWGDTTHPYDGVGQMLDTLTQRGVPMGVFSNKPHDFTMLCVTKLLGEWSFGVVRGVSDSTPRKPDPAGALDVAAGLGIEPARTLYVGDTGTDMVTGNNAGMYTVGVTWGFRGVEELRANGARQIITAPGQLLDLF